MPGAAVWHSPRRTGPCRAAVQRPSVQQARTVSAEERANCIAIQEMRRSSAASAGTSGRSEQGWPGSPHPSRRSSARSQDGSGTWSRKLEPRELSTRPAKIGERSKQDSRQRGPVQTAVWTERQPAHTAASQQSSGTYNTSSRRSDWSPGEQKWQEGETYRRWQYPRRSSGASEAIDERQLRPQTISAGTLAAAAQSSGRRSGDAKGMTARTGVPVTNPASEMSRNETRDNASTPRDSEDRLSGWPAAQTGGPLPKPRSSRFAGLWGRRPGARRRADPLPSESASSLDSPAADDWAENGVAAPETDDGWGAAAVIATAAEASAAQSREPAGAAPDGSQAPANAPFQAVDATRGEGDATVSAAAAPEEEEVFEDESGDPEDGAELEEEGPYPDITLLSAREVEELLPVVPSAEQMSASWGRPMDVWQRLGAATVLTIVTAKLNLVLFASGSATYPFWGPVLLSANRNWVLRKRGRHIGFWRTRVLGVEIIKPERRRYTDRTVAGPAVSQPLVRFLLGDESGARSQLSLPFNRRYEQIQIGEPAELLVLSMQSSFESFKALKEVYLPASGLWLSEYPHVDRGLFLDVSLDIERERQREMREGAVEAWA